MSTTGNFFDRVVRLARKAMVDESAVATGGFVDPAGVDFGPYMCLADKKRKVFSVFDDLRYDRSDADILTPAMRKHAIQQLGGLGFRQISGTVLENPEEDIRCFMPKFHALGGSPFDTTRYTDKRAQDYFILTPTQTACQFIDNYALIDAVEAIKALIREQPINLYRLWDYLEKKPAHQEFLSAIGHLKYVQREAVSAEPLRYRRALG